MCVCEGVYKNSSFYFYLYEACRQSIDKTSKPFPSIFLI